MNMRIEAPAKVNLCLAVEYPPQDGYHALTSVFQTLDLHDTLEFDFEAVPDAPARLARTSAGTPVDLDCGGLELATQDNLIFKALDGMELAFGKTLVEGGDALRVVVEKRIPAGGGLGGGSSDAAAAIKAAAARFGADPLDERCLALARSLGADVAFFLYGGAALMDGRGDTLVRRLPDFPLPLVLMGERQGISTAAIYKAFDANPPKPGDAAALAACMESATPDAHRLANMCTNNLEPAACEALPRLGARVAAANGNPHVLHALVTGSGATSYCICADEDEARAAASELSPLCDWVHVAAVRERS